MGRGVSAGALPASIALLCAAYPCRSPYGTACCTHKINNSPECQCQPQVLLLVLQGEGWGVVTGHQGRALQGCRWVGLRGGRIEEANSATVQVS